MNKEIAEICQNNGYINPVELLTALTNGHDLRKVSLVYEWLEAFEDENGDEAPTDFDWQELKALIKKEGRKSPVSIKDSLSAQKALLEHLHAKKKAIDVTVHNNELSVTPLTRLEVKRFKRKFDKLV